MIRKIATYALAVDTSFTFMSGKQVSGAEL